MTIKIDSDVNVAIQILKESHRRLKEALKSGETTGYYSGGEFSAQSTIGIDEEE